MTVAIGGIVGLTMLALAASAPAASRYAAPSGSGAECSQVSPCSFNTAVAGAKPDDEVIARAGVHTVTATALLPAAATGVHIHGELGAARPTIAGAIASFPLLRLDAAGSRASHLELQNTAGGAVGLQCAAGATVERVFARAIGNSSAALRAYGSCTLRDSIATASGVGAVAVVGIGDEQPGGNLELVRNVTAIASGSKSVGARSAWNSVSEGASILSLRNSIVSGTASDLEASSFFGVGKIHVSHSNFDSATLAESGAGSIVDQGGNQTAPPLFVDAAAGDYRQAPGSPTIDAGIDDLLGPTDYEGNPRLLGPAPDIGAFELVPAAAPAPLPGTIQSLALKPVRFAALRAGQAIFSAAVGKTKVPLGTGVSYSLSAAGVVEFAVERKVAGRRVGKRCVKRTSANADRRKCPLFRRVRGGFSHSGQAGQNRFGFSGRLAGRALKPGAYRLTGRTGTTSRTATFRIVK